MSTPLCPMRPPVVVACFVDDAEVTQRARDLAGRHGLILREMSPPGVTRGRLRRRDAAAIDELRLWVNVDGLSLEDASDANLSPIRVDFQFGATGYRRKTAMSRRQPLARSIGLRGDAVRVFDATAGLGRDAFLLACMGCRVAAAERSPILVELLGDGIARARDSTDQSLREIASRIVLLEGDARDRLLDLRGDGLPDVVYIDPMYPARRKSASGAGELRVLRRLVGDDDDVVSLLDIARTRARRRVVVKRPRRARPVAAGVDVCHEGRSVRYDVYLTHAEQ